jgi:hypothetical protein
MEKVDGLVDRDHDVDLWVYHRETLQIVEP